MPVFRTSESSAYCANSGLFSLSKLVEEYPFFLFDTIVIVIFFNGRKNGISGCGNAPFAKALRSNS
jgi:hypothetical protein